VGFELAGPVVDAGNLPVMNEFQDKVIIVVGGTGGIGSAVARQLKSEGAVVVLAARNEERLRQLGEELGAETHVVDATQGSEVEALVTGVVQRHGRLDGAVNCVGSILLKPAHLTTDVEWATTVSQNLYTAFHVTRAACRAMMPSGGSLVLCSSVAATRGLVNHEAIAAAKAGVEGLALAAAASYARSRIRVNCVAPGLTRTPLTRQLTENEAVAKASASMHPLGRVGESGEIASAIVWLLSPKQSWVTGQVIGVDGGLGRVQARG
jgi:3-oxoacyl-[acyl-carrier protein] reductase